MEMGFACIFFTDSLHRLDKGFGQAKNDLADFRKKRLNRCCKLCNDRLKSNFNICLVIPSNGEIEATLMKNQDVVETLPMNWVWLLRL